MYMRKFSFLIVLLLLCGQVFAVGGKCGENVKWNLDKNGVLTISGKGDMYDYEWDSKEKAYNTPFYKHRESIISIIINEGVTSIGKGAFCKCNKLNSIKIPNSVKSIGIYAFEGCTGLTSVTIPNSVTSIGESAFGCSGLTSVTIPNSVTSIEWGAFEGCSSLTSVTIPNNVTSIRPRVFQSCTHLTSIEIPNSVKSIGIYAFEGCTGLTSIEIPNSVTSIGYCAFDSCISLTTIIMSNRVTSIQLSTFQHCKSLTSIEIPNSVTSIGNYAFEGCSGLTSVTIGNSVTSIEWGAFEGCSSLTSIEIPNSVTYIGKDAFYCCRSLTSVTIPNSVTSIGDCAFCGCSSLAIVNYPKGLDLSKTNIPSSAKLIAYDPKGTPQTSPTQLPLLALVEGSVRFNDGTRNNRIDANEKCEISFEIRNNGKGIAQNCEARIRLSGNTTGITANTIKLPSIPVGKTHKVTIPISSNINTQDGKVTLSVEVYEPNGFGVAPFNLAVATKAYDPPYLQVVDYNIASNSGKIRKMEPFTLSFNLQNTRYGDAENVKVKVILPANIFPIEGVTEFAYPKIQSGEVVKVNVPLIANNNYSTDQIPITIDVREKYGKYAENRRLSVAMNQTTSSSTINIAAKEEPQQERKEIQLAMMTSEVDRNIPVAKSKNQNTFVLIIANEHYQQVASVPFALNDGNIFREYCIKTLGIGEKHIKYLADATGNQIKAGVNWLNNVVETFDEPQIIVYYAGHGIPDESSKSAYLLPVDGSGTDVTTGYKLDDLYATLGNMPASRIAVFMDACFSGSKREQGMLASARGVALKAKSGVPQGNMVVFSAAQGDETAYPNREQQHGLFTYYLLKKLQDTEGNVTLKDLGDYVTKQVSQQSLLLNDKRQTPSVIPSTSLGSEWQTWKLK